MEYSTPIIIMVCLFALIPLLVAVWNSIYLTTPKSSFGKGHYDESGLSVSVLIPARNEAKNIEKVLKALRFQGYSNYEVIVLNDRSEDCTAALVRPFADSDFSVRLIEGEEPPHGWIGKNWACHQLSLEAKGDYLLFIDADTVLHKDAIRMAVRQATMENSDLLTMIPSRCANNFVERSIYGFIDWAIYAWLPLALAHKSTNSYLSASYGQFMLFKKESYILTGGHKKIKDIAVDDFGLGRLIKSSGLQWNLKDGTNIVTTLPYSSLWETVRGVSRSLAPALDYRVSLIFLISLGLIVLFCIPVVYIFLGFIEDDYFGHLSILSFGAILPLMLSYFMTCKKFSHSLMILPLMHLTVVFMIMIAYHSLFSNLFKFATWKERNMVIRKIKF
ncbi:glycosyltransferase family 2 protein [Chloroflexi bacterium]|nr:glycosyltransferase family 2 protein [Chloroflexota bacterium]